MAPTVNAVDLLLGDGYLTRRPALVGNGVELSRRGLRARVDALTRLLGVGIGERVAIIGPNAPAIVVGLAAAWRAGAVAVPLNARLRRYELARVLADAEASTVVSLRQHGGFAIAEAVTQLAASLPTLRRQIVVDELGEIETQVDFAATAPADPLPESAAAILYTSGSTGEPRGAVLSHTYSVQAADSFVGVLGTLAELPTGFIVPCSHMFGYATLLTSFRAAGCAVLLDAAAPIAALASQLERRGVQVLHGPPTLFSALTQLEPTHRMRTGFVAGARCPPKLFARCEARGLMLLNQYGMTEVGAVTACRLDDAEPIRHNTVGRPLAGFEIRAADQQVGPSEILIRSEHLWPSLFRRPWGPAMTSDGWVKTGDLGFVDADGNVTIAGRAKDMVKVGGFSVFPAEVESFLSSHPKLSAAAVVGMPHRLLGEALVAFVVASGDDEPSRRELMAFCRAGIAGYKVPVSFTFLDTLPQLPSGKVDRGALAQSAAADSATSSA
jgi:HIP---CoA ligase